MTYEPVWRFDSLINFYLCSDENQQNTASCFINNFSTYYTSKREKLHSKFYFEDDFEGVNEINQRFLPDCVDGTYLSESGCEGILCPILI